MEKQEYYVVKSYRDFAEFYKICRRMKVPYFKKYNLIMSGNDTNFHYRSAWFTPEQFTFFTLLVQESYPQLLDLVAKITTDHIDEQAHLAAWVKFDNIEYSRKQQPFSIYNIF